MKSTTGLAASASQPSPRGVAGQTWMRGIIFEEGQKTEVYFAAKYTRPLRDEMMADEGGGLEVGSTPTD